MLSRVTRLARPALTRAARETYAFSSYLRSFARQRSQVGERWAGARDLDAAPRVAVFSHFDARGVVHDFVRYYLREIHEAGYTIVFVSNAPRLRPADVEWLRPFCGAILRRNNVGLDFGAFKDGIAAIPEPRRREALLLANDSVYGPFYELRQVVARMDPGESDVWSITDSWDRRFHLQSFFLLFGPRALASEAFDRFWRGVRHVQAKAWVISRYEIGLTRAMLAGGLRCRALFPYRTVAAGFTEAFRAAKEEEAPGKPDALEAREREFRSHLLEAIDTGVPLNGTHFFWEYLIQAAGCPFIKRELLRKNPARIPGLPRWEDVIRSVSHYDTDMIVRHLEVSMRNRAI